MYLFEALTNNEGTSYERAYVWASNIVEGRKVFVEKYPDTELSQMNVLFSSDAKPFCSELDTEGFEMSTGTEERNKEEVEKESDTKTASRVMGVFEGRCWSPDQALNWALALIENRRIEQAYKRQR